MTENDEKVESTTDGTMDPVTDSEVTETPTVAPAASTGPQVVGALTNPEDFDATPANICVECGGVWPIDKGVASCPACGGKTVSGFRFQKKAILEADDARFTGDSAKEATKKDDTDA